MRSPAAIRLSGALLVCGLVAGCASTVSRRAIDVAPWGRGVLEGARTLWIAAAVCRTGDAASGEAAIRGEPAGAGRRPVDGEGAMPAANLDGGPRTAPGAAAPAGGCGAAGVDLGEELARAVRRARGIELAPAPDRSDLVLYFEQADRLRCFFCPQPEDRWYWWGLVLDPDGRELASMHGETAAGPGEPARQFVSGVKQLTRRKKGT